MRRGDAISAVQAGIISGTFVAVFFFVADLIQLTPLSTPLALMQELSLQGIPQDGRNTGVDLATMSEVASWLRLGVRLLALTALHFLAFALLALAAVAFFDLYPLPLNAATGAAWGLFVYSLVFELSMAIASPDLVAGVPTFWTVAGVNLLAGAIMGGYVQLRRRRRGES